MACCRSEDGGSCPLTVALLMDIVLHDVAAHLTLLLFPPPPQVFHDWLLPSLSALPHDDEEAVRVEYAQGVAALAGAAHRHLLRMQHDSNDAGGPERTTPRGPPIRCACGVLP
jgi:hypothetical protein